MALTIIILLAVEIGGLAIVYVVLRERLRRAASAAAQSRELREEVGRLVVELNQTTERNVALVEDAVARLNELLGKADKKIGLLRREADRHDGGMELYARLESTRARGAQESPRVVPAASRTHSPGAGVQPDATKARFAPPPLAAAPEAGPADVREEAVRLGRRGFAPALIAQRLGLPLGEVELIVSLDRRRGSGEEPSGESRGITGTERGPGGMRAEGAPEEGS